MGRKDHSSRRLPRLYLRFRSRKTMIFPEPSPSEAIVMDLVHDLRQPLGNIETSAYCLNLLTDPAQIRAHEHLRAIEQQVAHAAALLTEAAAELRRLRS